MARVRSHRSGAGAARLRFSRLRRGQGAVKRDGGSGTGREWLAGFVHLMSGDKTPEVMAPTKAASLGSGAAPLLQAS